VPNGRSWTTGIVDLDGWRIDTLLVSRAKGS
jgi:hypothetical protein